MNTKDNIELNIKVKLNLEYFKERFRDEYDKNFIYLDNIKLEKMKISKDGKKIGYFMCYQDFDMIHRKPLWNELYENREDAVILYKRFFNKIIKERSKETKQMILIKEL